MRLYFNGCSHTYGDDLSDKLQAWPSLVAKQLGCSYLNDSISGGSNDRIMYRVLKNRYNFDKFFIAWTYTARFTRYRSDNNHDVDFNPQLKHGLYGDCAEFKNYGKLHYVFWHNELFNFKLWLQNIILLQFFFNAINKPYVMINATNNQIDQWSASWPYFTDSIKSLVCFDLMNDDQLYDEWQEIQQLLSQVDYTHFYGWGKWWITKLHQSHPCGKTGHLLEAGHHAIAEYILNYDSN